jgi:hypothetical protein
MMVMMMMMMMMMMINVPDFDIATSLSSIG